MASAFHSGNVCRAAVFLLCACSVARATVCATDTDELCCHSNFVLEVLADGGTSTHIVAPLCSTSGSDPSTCGHATLSVRKWKCTCPDCLDGNNFVEDCNATCDHVLGDKVVSRTLVHFGYNASSLDDNTTAGSVSDANLANTITKMDQLYDAYLIERSNAILEADAGGERREENRRLGEVNFDTATVKNAPSIDTARAYWDDAAWAKCPYDCCSCDIDANGKPTDATQEIPYGGRSTSQRAKNKQGIWDYDNKPCKTSTSVDDKYCTDWSYDETACLRLNNTAQYNTELQRGAPSVPPKTVRKEMEDWLKTIPECSEDRGLGWNANDLPQGYKSDGRVEWVDNPFWVGVYPTPDDPDNAWTVGAKTAWVPPCAPGSHWTVSGLPNQGKNVQAINSYGVPFSQKCHPVYWRLGSAVVSHGRKMNWYPFHAATMVPSDS